MSKIQALMNYLGIDNEVDIKYEYGCYEYNNQDYEIMTEEEVIDFGKDLIDDNITNILHDCGLPEDLHEYFDREKYVNDRIDDAFEYVDFGKGFQQIEDNEQNIYFLFPL
jgi:hypothetical protein